ncbi:DUF3696 domain-containing protein [Geomonas subterranea]|uniref:DUF3696 domain-containing protein n=1 Tax=Geomonas subterranea TaxID=2847989 RepID=UPI001CD680F8|nr:AAA family ATPase [Geomonas fuzhouensis]
MIIKALTIENFKGIREPVRVEFKPITLLFGPNSAGKSTIVQALHYAREVLAQNNVDADRVSSADDSFDLGGFVNIVHKHDLNLSIKLKFEISFSPLADYTDFLKETVDSAWIEYEIKWSNFLETPLVKTTIVGLAGEYFGRIDCAEDGKRARISDVNYKHHLLGVSEIEIKDEKTQFPQLLIHLASSVKDDFWFSEKSDENLGLFVDQVTALPQFSSLNEDIRSETDAEEETGTYSGEPNSWEMVNDFFRTYFSGLTSILRNELKVFRYIGPIRKTPPRIYSPVRTEDESRWSSGLAAWDLMYNSSPSFIKSVNAWISGEHRLNTGYRVTLKRYKEIDLDGPAYRAIAADTLLDDSDFLMEELDRTPEKRRISLIDERRGIEVQPYDIGIGISQVLPVVIAALDDKTDFVIIEQPELHIHPGLQVSMGDLFIAQIQDGAKTFILETHSEHLLLRLLRRIRETSEGWLPADVTRLTPEQVSVNYLEQVDDTLRIRQLLVSAEGDSVGEWPKGFFEERAGELF